jgi:hypothetical protein
MDIAGFLRIQERNRSERRFNDGDDGWERNARHGVRYQAGGKIASSFSRRLIHLSPKGKLETDSINGHVEGSNGAAVLSGARLARRPLPNMDLWDRTNADAIGHKLGRGDLIPSRAEYFIFSSKRHASAICDRPRRGHIRIASSYNPAKWTRANVDDIGGLCCHHESNPALADDTGISKIHGRPARRVSSEG